MSGARRLGRAAIALAATAIVAAAGLAIRGPLEGWLIADGAPRAQRALHGDERLPAPPDQAWRLHPDAHRVRVVMLDGLARADAHTPALDALCAAGTDLAIDVGFPTKSLPVQAALWTGLTAQQLGLGPHNGARALPGALPRQIAGSIAIVESWTVIARSMGFSRVAPDAAADRVRPDHDPAAAARWGERFADEAVAAAGSDAGLVMIHVLAIDAAAHAHGRGGAAYRDAIAAADHTLARAIAARPGATWLVLADHGHLPRGGHGDAEAEVRIVRGCLSQTRSAAPHQVHLIDLARHLREVMSVPPLPGAVGRRLEIALHSAHDPDATLPATPVTRPIAAALVLLVASILSWRRVRPRWALAWLPAAALAYVAWRGVPSLSFRDPPGAVLCAALFALPLVTAVRDHRSRMIALTLPAVGAAVAAALLAGVPAAVVDGTAPAVPFWTAVLEVVASVASAALAAAAGLLAWSATPDTSQPRG